ncbi:MAG: hypothetical protein H6821_03420 [Planctomycetaceae bacterium]|nr:hypothetical protein [Planctomycetaceae bacterium]MCB9940726.1 hypothetical protein [Planctomycetaceae bacterium]
MTFNDDGSFSYRPKNGFAGEDSFQFKANDGTESSESATYSITVTNTAPVATAMTLTVVSGQTVSDTAAGTDSDSQDKILSFRSTKSAKNGTVAFSEGFGGGGFSYTPNDGFIGTDSFTFWVLDGVIDANGKLSGKSEEATVTITVKAPAPPPPPDTHPCGTPALLVVDVTKCFVVHLDFPLKITAYQAASREEHVTNKDNSDKDDLTDLLEEAKKLLEKLDDKVPLPPQLKLIELFVGGLQTLNVGIEELRLDISVQASVDVYTWTQPDPSKKAAWEKTGEVAVAPMKLVSKSKRIDGGGANPSTEDGQTKITNASAALFDTAMSAMASLDVEKMVSDKLPKSASDVVKFAP